MSKQVYPLGEGISLTADSRVQAAVHLGSPGEDALEAIGPAVPPWFQRDSGALETAVGADPGPGVLTLTGVSNGDLITAENPLVLMLEDAPLDGDTILPYTFDGEFFLPLGNARSQDGRTEIRIEHLPMPAEEDALESLNAIKIMFQKIASGVPGIKYDYPRLAAADVTDDGFVSYEDDLEEVRRRVAAAEKILLYVHGLFGETGGYVASAVAAEVEDGDPPKLKDRYNLILAFDYESINTPVEITARQLRQKLEAVGLGAGHDKTLHIVAHSLGGLVSRWFVEQEGGKDMVQHLVTAGTPHLGTPWPKIHSLATTLLALGLNGLSAVAWPVKIAASLVKATEVIDVTVDQMDPNSTFMRLLASNPDPGIPITLLAGNTSIAPAAAQAGPDGTSALDRLLDRLQAMDLIEKAAGLAFFGRPNDIAVGVESAFGVPQSHAQVSRVEIACDHMSFFLLSESLTRLAEALEK